MKTCISSFFCSLDTSDTIQLLGIVSSLIASIIAIVISLVSTRQNSKMIENASRPFISIYIDALTICEQTSFFVIKNFGASPARITRFIYDPILKETHQKNNLICNQFDYVENIVLAPGRSKLLEYDLPKLPVDDVHFHIEYSFNNVSYSEDVTLNTKNYIHIPVTRPTSQITDENEREVQTLRELLERSM